MNTKEIVGRLEGVIPRGEGQWVAHCPSHEDRRQSLSVARGKKGTVVKCFAGCAPEEIAAALGVRVADLFDRELVAPGQGLMRGGVPAETVYQYRDESGCLLFEVVRKPGKMFVQRRPDAADPDHWIYKLDGVRRVPYRLPEVLKAGPDEIVFLVEGEKDVENLRRLGLVATTNPGGTGAGGLWKGPTFAAALAGRRVVVLPDNDEPGRKHAALVSQALGPVTRSIQVLSLPNLPTKGDVSDWIGAGGTKEELLRLASEAPAVCSAKHDSPGVEDANEPLRKTQAQQMVELVEEQVELFRNQEDEAFASAVRNGRLETWSLRSSVFRDFLISTFLRSTGKAPSASGLTDAIATLQAIAMEDDKIRQVELRAARLESSDTLYFDLSNPSRRIVEISAHGVRMLDAADAPVRFRRSKSQLALPEPEFGGTIDELRKFINAASDDSTWYLAVSWLAFAMQARGPFPVLVVQGEQGSAKSTTSRVLRGLVDPSHSELRIAPKREGDLMIAAKNSYVLAFDNLSGMQSWLSDGLCILSTGGAYTSRRLYSDDEEVTLRATRPVIVNGIDDMTTRPDFADRAVMLSLPTIAPEHRREESEFWGEFMRVRPRLLGSLFSAVAAALREFPNVKLAQLPRMADFARFGVALERGLHWPAGAFLNAYLRNLNETSTTALEADQAAMALVLLMRNAPEHGWEGTTAELLAALEWLVPFDKRTKGWPTSPQSLTGRIRRSAPALRQEGIEPGTPQRQHRGAMWHLRRLPRNSSKGSSMSSPFQEAQELQALAQDDAGVEPECGDEEAKRHVTNGVDVSARHDVVVTRPNPLDGDRRVELDELDELFTPSTGKRGREGEVPPVPVAALTDGGEV